MRLKLCFHEQILTQHYKEVNSDVDQLSKRLHSLYMEEYLKRSESFEKRLSIEPVTPREELYLLFRMAGPLMQSKLGRFIDLTQIPVTFLHGNPHMDNYVKTFRGSAMLDFDRSRMGPYCWDIIRFLSSLSLRGESKKEFLDRKVVDYFIDAYITHYLNPDIPAKRLKMLKNADPQKWQLNSRSYLDGNKKWAKKMRENPLALDDAFIQELLKKYLESRQELILLDEYKVSEVGMCPGSFGKNHYIYALVPRNPDSHKDAIILDIKEVYEEKDTKFFFNPFPHHGLRMIEASKIFADGMEERLGYCTLKNDQYWGRQIPSFAVKVKSYLSKNEQMDFAYSVASELGKGHRKGLPDGVSVDVIEKDFLKNFDAYFKIAKLLTLELELAHESIKKKNKLYQDYRSW
jgi:hypothetical protein